MFVVEKSMIDELWIVGEYDNGKWWPESDHKIREEAIQACNEMNLKQYVGE